MRRKIIAIVLAAACLCSCSGSGSAKPCDVDEKFRSDVTITQGGKEFCAEMRRADADIWELDFSKPDTVAGMKLGFTGSICTLEFEGLKYELDRSQISQYSMASLCCGAVEQLIAKRGLDCRKTDDSLVEKGTVSGEDFEAFFDSGKLTKIAFGEQLICDFQAQKSGELSE
ncbi:MAG: hypothetical protein II574_10160 [Ruminococcus sp.]|nr:hypothetical protein [Ruminococcus sp.]